MSETPVLPPALAAQVAEAAASAPGFMPTKPTVTFRGREWEIADKPGATMLYYMESDHVMHAIESVLPGNQFAAFLALNLEIEELEEFVVKCNTVWGLEDSGN